MGEVTRILTAIEQGDEHATNQLLPLVYQELRLLAAQKLSREPTGQTLDATALVHEAYIRLVGGNPQEFSGRGHFFSAAAEAMRRILIENARRKKSLRCGGGRHRLDVDDVQPTTEPSSDDLLALDEALEAFAEVDSTKAQLVKLRYFAGLTTPQAAELLGISVATAERYWTYARAWLRKEILKGEEK